MKKSIQNNNAEPKKDAAEIIEKMATQAAPQRAIARRLGVSLNTFRDWLTRYPELQEAHDAGRDAEHAIWYENLCMHAAKSPIPGMFMLKARHGYREGDQSEQANRVAITFNIPGAQPLQAFLNQHGRMLDHKDGGNE